MRIRHMTSMHRHRSDRLLLNVGMANSVMLASSTGGAVFSSYGRNCFYCACARLMSCLVTRLSSESNSWMLNMTVVMGFGLSLSMLAQKTSRNTVRRVNMNEPATLLVVQFVQPCSASRGKGLGPATVWLRSCFLLRGLDVWCLTSEMTVCC